MTYGTAHILIFHMLYKEQYPLTTRCCLSQRPFPCNIFSLGPFHRKKGATKKCWRALGSCLSLKGPAGWLLTMRYARSANPHLFHPDPHLFQLNTSHFHCCTICLLCLPTQELTFDGRWQVRIREGWVGWSKNRISIRWRWSNLTKGTRSKLMPDL